MAGQRPRELETSPRYSERWPEGPDRFYQHFYPRSSTFWAVCLEMPTLPPIHPAFHYSNHAFNTVSRLRSLRCCRLLQPGNYLWGCIQSGPDGASCSTVTVTATEQLIPRVYQNFEKLLVISYQKAHDFSAAIASSFGELLMAYDRYLQILF